MATKIKLMRLGKMRAPYYRIVVADARTKRDGRSIETIGKYHPKQHPSFIEVNSERAQYWLGVGAQPTEAVAAILRVTGDWQLFKGEPAPEPMQVAAAKPDKRALFEAATKQGTEEPTAEATTPKKRAAKAPKAATEKAATEKAAAKAPKAATEKPATEKPATDKAVADTPPADTPPAESPLADNPTAGEAGATAMEESTTPSEQSAAVDSPPES